MSKVMKQTYTISSSIILLICVQANLNGDMILTWEEELIWQYNFQKKKAGESK